MMLRCKMEIKRLEVLVVEDTEKHIERAKKLQEICNVTVVSTYQKGVTEISSKQYDVVLTDLFMPWYLFQKYPLESDDQMDEVRTPQALGYPLAMIALAAGVQYVGIVTDANHHKGAMAASTDDVSPQDAYSAPMKIIGNQGGAQLRFFKDEKKNWDYALKVLLGDKAPYNEELTTVAEYKRMLSNRW